MINYGTGNSPALMSSDLYITLNAVEEKYEKSIIFAFEDLAAMSFREYYG